MVDRHIGRKALETGKTYFCKNKVEIPPLSMQDDTQGISESGFKTRAMNEFLNHRTNLMNLQYGSEKCVKVHIGKTHEKSIFSDLSFESWKEQVIEHKNGRTELKDTYIGKSVMENVSIKKYLGDLVSCDRKPY